MRAAPPVDAALDDARLERMVTILLHALAGGVLSAWLALHAGLPVGMALAASVLLCALGFALLGVWLVRRALSVPAGRLIWDGRQWRWRADGADVPLQQVIVALDLGGWMLLRLCPQATGVPAHPGGALPTWRIATARSARGAWHGLRLALAAHAGTSVDAATGEALR